MRTVGAFEAKTHLSQLLHEVAEGQRITITRHGEPVALLIPVGEERPAAAERAMRAWIQYRDSHDITLGPDITIRDLVEEGRRF